MRPIKATGDPDPKPYRRLDDARLIASLTLLYERIRERFPNASLARVCQDVIAITRDNTKRAAAIGQSHWRLRLGIALIIMFAIGVLLKLLLLVDWNIRGPDSVYTLAQGISAAIYIVFAIAGAVFFLVTMEDRLKRRRALKALAELRSIIHVIDMHQLTKDPASILAGGAPTAHSPKRPLTPFQLGRYLDYCTEMLSLVAKVAVLYAQNQPDPVVVDAVADIERLTTNLSQQIWQKIMLVHTSPGGFAAPPLPPAPADAQVETEIEDA